VYTFLGDYMAKKKYDPTNKHLTHPAEVREGKGPHAGQLYCLKCKKHIKWLTELEVKIAQNSP
jgi:hypothetical protein